MFYFILLPCLISVSIQTKGHCSLKQSDRKGSAVTSDHCSIDTMEDIEYPSSGDTANSIDCDTKSVMVDSPQKSYDKPGSMAVVLYNEESILPMHKSERRFQFAGREIKIQQNWSELGVAAVVWDAAIVLCKYLEDHPSVVQSKNVLELGAGTGLAGLVSSFLGGRTTITDRQEVLSFLGTSVEENTIPEDRDLITVAALDWTKDLNGFGRFDVILGADIVYIEDSFDDLLNSLLHLSGEETIILLSCRIRYDRDTNFLDKMKNGFTIEEILYDVKTDVKIFKAKKR